MKNPSRRPARSGRRRPASPDFAERRVEELRRVGRRRRALGAEPPSHAARAVACPPPRLLGRDQVAVVRLAAVDDLDLGRRARRRGSAAPAPRPRRGRAVAVVERDQLVARLERRDRREDRLVAVAVDRDEPVVGVERDRLALLDLLAADRRVRTASVTWTDWIARLASVIGPALAAASSVGSRARRAAKPSAALRVGTTTRRLSSQTFAACSAARRTFGLLGRSRTSRARARRATASSSPVLGIVRSGRR